MDTNKMREDFELFMADLAGIEPSELAKSFTGEDPETGWTYRVKDSNGDENELASKLVGVAWMSWQASRDAVVVTLPRITGHEYDPLADADYREGCREAIEAQGLRVSP